MKYSLFITKTIFKTNKKPTNWWGRQNAAPLKFDPKPSEAAFWMDRFLELPYMPTGVAVVIISAWL